ncbi:MAG: hypothetical protein EOP85_16195 [Verrucomicrobiaceae bacterium]|nr:MAG: hypothetical protein EOP85_16195 [Verrucomicrobiaceae bacterium]
MKPTVEQIGTLLALKRDERPEEGYWQDFLCEFHQKQRQQAVKKAGFANALGQVSEWFSSVSPTKWVYSAGVAYASIAAFMLLAPKDPGAMKMESSPVNFQVVPASTSPPVEQLDQLDLSPSTQGSAGEQIF